MRFAILCLLLPLLFVSGCKDTAADKADAKAGEIKDGNVVPDAPLLDAPAIKDEIPEAAAEVAVPVEVAAETVVPEDTAAIDVPAPADVSVPADVPAPADIKVEKDVHAE